MQQIVLAAQSADHVRIVDGFVSLEGHEDLVDESRMRTSQNRTLNGGARCLALEFARELSRLCPSVESVALSGSVASGGYIDGDDVDFDLFVRDGTKYTVYLFANLLGLRYSLRYLKRSIHPEHRIGFLPKVICINVVWPSSETKPFLRQDAGMAFELLRCEPLVGTGRFAEMLSDNPWIDSYLPQARARRWDLDDPTRGSGTPALLSRLFARPWTRRLLERTCRIVSYAMYRTVQEFRKRDPGARERMEFLRRTKYPYEVFQD